MNLIKIAKINYKGTKIYYDDVMISVCAPMPSYIRTYSSDCTDAQCLHVCVASHIGNLETFTHIYIYIIYICTMYMYQLHTTLVDDHTEVQLI